MKQFNQGSTYKIRDDKNYERGLITVLDRKQSKITYIDNDGKQYSSPAYPGREAELLYHNAHTVRATS